MAPPQKIADFIRQPEAQEDKPPVITKPQRCGGAWRAMLRKSASFDSREVAERYRALDRGKIQFGAIQGQFGINDYLL